MINGFAIKFIAAYLLLPLLAVLLGVLVYVIAKKNKLLNNKKVIFYILLCGVILGLPGLLGFFDYNFMPYMYSLLAIIYLVLGCYSQSIMLHFLKDLKGKSFFLKFMFNLSIMFLGSGLFSLFFNLTNELQYGLWACTCVLPFLFPMLYEKALQCYLDIPAEIYKIWKYSDEYDSDSFNIDLEKVMVVDLELFRKVDDTDSERITGKVSEDSIFGQWFQRMIDDCNRKSPADPIVYQNDAGYFEWIFYIKPSFFSRRKYIDPDYTFADNNLKRRCTIIAKRVMNENDQTEKEY